MTTNLLGRNLISGWDGKVRGTIVGVFHDRGEASLIVERIVEHALDGRTELHVETLCNVLLQKPNEDVAP